MTRDVPSDFSPGGGAASGSMSPMIAGVTFDHVAVAASDRTVLNQRYAGDLGVRYLIEGATAGLYATLMSCCLLYTSPSPRDS